jgi:hypothetical protein
MDVDEERDVKPDLSLLPPPVTVEEILSEQMFLLQVSIHTVHFDIMSYKNTDNYVIMLMLCTVPRFTSWPCRSRT